MHSVVTRCPGCRAQRDAIWVADTPERERLTCTVCGVDLSEAARNIYQEDSRVLFDAWLDGGIPELAKYNPAVVRVVSWLGGEVVRRFAKEASQLTNAERYRFLDQYFGNMTTGGY